jgi:hypothetical protein
MYLPHSIFSHDSHVVMLGMNQSCGECHPPELQRSAETAKPCSECHTDDELTLKVLDATIKFEGTVAVSYTDAVHGLCVGCHDEVAAEIDKPHHAVCSTCHEPEAEPGRAAEWARRRQTTYASKWVVTTRPATLDPEKEQAALLDGGEPGR